MPYGITFILMSRREPILSTVLVCRCTAILLFFNSPLNPILYCWKYESSEKSYKGNSSRDVVLAKIHPTLPYDLSFLLDTAVVHTEIEVPMFFLDISNFNKL